MESFQEDEHRVKLKRGNHDLHIQLFSAWLHPDLRDLPGIDWTEMPASVTGYLMHTVCDSPYAPHIALSVGTALGSFAPLTLRSFAAGLSTLLNTLPTHSIICNRTTLTPASRSK